MHDLIQSQIGLFINFLRAIQALQEYSDALVIVAPEESSNANLEDQLKEASQN